MLPMRKSIGERERERERESLIWWFPGDDEEGEFRFRFLYGFRLATTSFKAKRRSFVLFFGVWGPKNWGFSFVFGKY